MKVLDKVFVVTGGGSGIGRELVLQLVGRGARVAAVDLNETTLAETRELAGEKKDRISNHVLNIADRKAVEALPKEVIKIHGAIDGLINNAGIIQPFVRIKDLGYDAIDRVMNVNFYGPVYMTKTFLPYLLERPKAHIANVSSMGGFLPVPGQTLYGASKAAVKLFTEGLNSELVDTNVRVTVIFPGSIGTNIAVNSGVAIGMASAEESSFKVTPASTAAQVILDGIEKDSYRVLIGRDAKMMDFLYRLNPKSAAKLIFSQMKELLSQV